MGSASRHSWYAKNNRLAISWKTYLFKWILLVSCIPFHHQRILTYLIHNIIMQLVKSFNVLKFWSSFPNEARMPLWKAFCFLWEQAIRYWVIYSDFFYFYFMRVYWSWCNEGLYAEWILKILVFIYIDIEYLLIGLSERHIRCI